MDPVGPCYLSSVFQNVGLSVFILIALILISAFFAASETALSYCNRVRFKVKAENGSRSSKVIIKLLTKFDSSIIVILIGTNIFHICMSTFATLFACSFIYDQGVASLVATIATTLLVFFFSETIPKRIAKARPDGVAIFVCYPIYFFSILFYPLSILFMGIISLIKKMFHIKEDDNKMTEDDFQDIVEDVKDDGEIDSEESDIIQAAVDFSDITVKKVMVPISTVVMIDVNQSSRKQILDFLNHVTFTRIPVYDTNKDHIIGVLNTKKYLNLSLKSTNFSFKSILTNPIFVSETEKLDNMVSLFQMKHTHMAFVQAKSGNILGIITMEDVLEELVGEIDEKDTYGPVKKVGA